MAGQHEAVSLGFHRTTLPCPGGTMMTHKAEGGQLPRPPTHCPRYSHPLSCSHQAESPCRPGCPLPGPSPPGAGHWTLRVLENELTPCPVCSHALAEAPFLQKSVPTGPASTPGHVCSGHFADRRHPRGEAGPARTGLCPHVFWRRACGRRVCARLSTDAQRQARARAPPRSPSRPNHSAPPPRCSLGD